MNKKAKPKIRAVLLKNLFSMAKLVRSRYGEVNSDVIKRTIDTIAKTRLKSQKERGNSKPIAKPPKHDNKRPQLCRPAQVCFHP